MISFCASLLRRSEGLKVDLQTLKKNWSKGNHEDQLKGKSNPPHVVVPLRGRFKGETGELCHLMLLANKTFTGINI